MLSLPADFIPSETANLICEKLLTLPLSFVIYEKRGGGMRKDYTFHTIQDKKDR